VQRYVLIIQGLIKNIRIGSEDCSKFIFYEQGVGVFNLGVFSLLQRQSSQFVSRKHEATCGAIAVHCFFNGKREIPFFSSSV
jgi:hypothetical protein